LKQNTYYDYGSLLGSVDLLLFTTYKSLSDDKKPKIMKKYGISEELHMGGQTSILLTNIEEVLADDIKIDETYAATLIKYHSIVKLFLDFYVSMRESNKKDTKFPYAELARLLKETGFLSGSIYSDPK
jgi:hypothetical protein